MKRFQQFNRINVAREDVLKDIFFLRDNKF
jgi:hypothetical protein